jgi:hypothetical protein
VRVERSESLDEREASARIEDVMAVRDFAVELRTAAMKNSEDGSRYHSRSMARPIAALCVKQSPLPSRANKRSQTATKIFSEDRLPHVACQS